MEAKKLPIEALLDFWVNEMILKGYQAEYQRIAKKYNSTSPIKVIHYLTSLIRFSLKPLKEAVNDLLH
jgi:hypothetical protein